MGMLDLLLAISFPILERIPLFGDAALSPHGLGIAVGFGLGAVLMVRRARKRGLGRVHVPDVSVAVQDLLTRAAVGAILGARGFYVLTHLSDFEGRWHEVLYVWQGGLTFLGGVTGAILLAIPYARRQGWDLALLLDSAAPGIALGLLVGRLGDLAIGDHIGAPTDFPLAWRCTANHWERATNSFGRVEPLPYPEGIAPTAGCFDVAVHHTALYDFGAALVVLLVLLAMERRRWFDGAFIAAWVYVYGALRFTSDFARQDKTWVGLTGSQWALVAAAVGVTAWLLHRRPWQRDDWAWDLRFEHPWLTGTDQVARGADQVGDAEHRAGARVEPAPRAVAPAGLRPGPVDPERVAPPAPEPRSAPWPTERERPGLTSDPGPRPTRDGGGAPRAPEAPVPSLARWGDPAVPDDTGEPAQGPEAVPVTPEDLPGLTDTARDRVTRSSSSEPRMARRPRRPGDSAGA